MGNEDQALKYTPRRVEGTIIIPKVSILTRKIILEDLTEIYLNSDVLHALREHTLPEIVLEIQVTLIRRRTKENIMLTLQRMMILPGRESNKKVKILQVVKSMF